MPLPNFAGGPLPPAMGGGPPPGPPPGPPGTDPGQASLGGPGNSGATPDQVGAGVQSVMLKIRALGQAASDIGDSIPSLQDEVAQVQNIIRRMIVKAGQAAPTATESGSAVPMS